MSATLTATLNATLDAIRTAATNAASLNVGLKPAGPIAPAAVAAPASLFAPFCATCGAKLPALKRSAVACPHCGDELVRADGTLATRSRLRPWLVGASSLVLPGAGQAWNGQPIKGVAVLLTCWLVVPWIWGVADAWRTARRAALAPVRTRS